MKLKALTIFELLVLIVVFSLLAVLSFGVIRVFKVGMFNVVSSKNESISLQSLYWKLERTTFFCDSIKQSENSLIWFTGSDSLIITFSGEESSLRIHGSTETVNFGMETADVLLLEETEFVNYLKIHINKEQEEDWLFYKEYPTEKVFNRVKKAI